jgi:hypothetical protein
MGRTTAAVVRDCCFPGGVTALLLLASLLLVAAMVAALVGPLAAPARGR